MTTSIPATTARKRFEALLPDSYNPVVEQEGWVEFSIVRAGVYENGPRYRGNRLRNLASNILGPGHERFARKQRNTQIGTLAVGGWSSDNEQRACLDIHDTIYTPINPVDGNTAPIRHLSALHLISASRNADGFERQQGIKFNFLECGSTPTIYSSVGYHFQQAPGLSGKYEIAGINDFLEKQGIGADYQELNHRIVDLADLCITLAQP